MSSWSDPNTSDAEMPAAIAAGLSRLNVVPLCVAAGIKATWGMYFEIV